MGMVIYGMKYEKVRDRCEIVVIRGLDSLDSLGMGGRFGGYSEIGR